VQPTVEKVSEKAKETIAQVRKAASGALDTGKQTTAKGRDASKEKKIEKEEEEMPTSPSHARDYREGGQ
jgi:enoyl-CoA hydratase/carnithine racemase